LYLSFKDVKKKKILLVEPTKKYSLPLIEKQIVSHDTRLFKFGLPSKDHALGLPIGQHVHLTASVNGEVIIRAYTPVTSDDDLGHVDLIIKVKIS
jgi:cytochrome-b5 reductase